MKAVAFVAAFFENMRTVRDYINACQYVLDNIDAETERIIADNKEQILDLNRERQLFDKGIDSMGEQLQPYAPITIFDKRQRGLPYNRTTLFNYGSFYDGFDYLFRGNKISIFSRDSKSGELQDKYGTSIFGLIPENERILNYDIVKPELDNFIKKYL